LNSQGTIRQILLLTDFEIRKLFRQKSFYLGIIVILLLTALVTLGFYLRKHDYIGKKKQAYQGRLISEFINATALSESILLPGIYMVIPMVVGIMAAGSLAGEIQSGHVRSVALRPVPRWSLLASKYISVSFYAVVVLAVLLCVSYAVGAIIFGTSGDVLVFGNAFLGRGAGIYIFNEKTGLERLFLSYFFATYTVISLAAMFMMFSAISKNMVNASIVTLGVYYTSFILDALPFLEDLHRFLPTRYMMVWKYVMAQDIAWESLCHDGLFLAAYTLAYLLIAGIVFSSADL